jgi:hypothetical protein
VEGWISGDLEDLPHSALTDCTVRVVVTLPTDEVDATAVPFMNHIEVFPLVSRRFAAGLNLAPVRRHAVERITAR